MEAAFRQWFESRRVKTVVQETLEDFFRALRAINIPVSPAETIDAHRAVDTIGYSDRILLKDTLCVALAKSSDESRRFDDCFDMFFAREFKSQTKKPTAKNSESGTARHLCEGIAEAQNSELLQMLVDGDREALAQSMEQAPRGSDDEYSLRAQRLMVRRCRTDGIAELEAAIRALNQNEENLGGGGGGRTCGNASKSFSEARQYLDRLYELYARPYGEQLREEFLAETALSAVEQRDFDRMHKLVERWQRNSLDTTGAANPARCA